MPSNLPTGSEQNYLPAVEATGTHPAAPPAHDLPEPTLGPPPSTHDLSRYLAALRRYRWWIIVILVLGTAAGVGLGSLVDPEYEAQATIWIELPERGDVQGPIRSAQLLETTGWIDLLRSYIVLDHVVTELRLYLQPHDPADSVLLAGFELKDDFRSPGSYVLSLDEDGKSFELAEKGGEVLQRGMVGDSVGQDLGFAWVPEAGLLSPSHPVRFFVGNPRDISRTISGRLTPRMQQAGQFLRIELTGPDPRKITATVNAIAERYVLVAAELKSVKLDEQATLLFEQLQQAEENLRTADNELESFRIATITVPTERATPVAPGLLQTRDPVFTNFFNMKIEQDQLRRDREAIERALARSGDAPLSVAALEYIGEVRNSAELYGALQTLTNRRTELRELRSQYTDEYPLVRALADEIQTLERQTVPTLARNLISEINSRDAQIETYVRSTSTEMQRIPVRQLQEAQLTRRMMMAEQLYTNLRMRFETARLAAASAIPDIRVLEPAVVPRRPVSDHRPRLILMAFVGSLGFGILGAILLDRFDPRFRYPEQVTEGLRLNILGAVPVIKGPRGKGPGKSAAQVIEAFRELRLSVAHAYGAAGPLITVVTSSGSGDGKSFISGNLTLSFADQGYRTLLIDGDIRRGAQHRLLNVTGKPGLTDLLRGKATLDEVIRPTSYPNLHLIPCGTRLLGGVELLGSPAMSEMLQELRSRYQVIVIDSPPLGAGVDPFILGTLAGNVMLVLRTDYTDRQYTEAKLSLLDRLPIRILGAVLNAVPPRGIYRHYNYLPGYEEIGEGLVVSGDRLVDISS